MVTYSIKKRQSLLKMPIFVVFSRQALFFQLSLRKSLVDNKYFLVECFHLPIHEFYYINCKKNLKENGIFVNFGHNSRYCFIQSLHLSFQKRLKGQRIFFLTLSRFSATEGIKNVTKIA